MKSDATTTDADRPASRADLLGAPERLRARGLALGTPLHLLSSTTSTQDEAHRGAQRGEPSGAVWIAESQQQGRGRRGRTWMCAQGEGLLFSLLLRVDCAPARLPPLALVAGLAVRDAVANAAPLAQPRIKWPNDVLVADRKVAGVLVETISVGARVDAVVVGIGVNVHAQAFPSDIEGIATSIALSTDRPVDRARVFVDILEGLERDYPRVLADGLASVRARLDAADALVGKRVRHDSGDEGVASGVDDQGCLIVTRPDGVRTSWMAGEVHLSRAKTA